MIHGILITTSAALIPFRQNQYGINRYMYSIAEYLKYNNNAALAMLVAINIVQAKAIFILLEYLDFLIVSSIQ